MSGVVRAERTEAGAWELVVEVPSRPTHRIPVEGYNTKPEHFERIIRVVARKLGYEARTEMLTGGVE